MAKLPNIKRWSDQKLEMELGFAVLAHDASHPENVAWRNRLEIEVARRILNPRNLETEVA